jgi:hypothetical protein
LVWHTRINGTRTTERRKEPVSIYIEVYTSEKNRWISQQGLKEHIRDNKIECTRQGFGIVVGSLDKLIQLRPQNSQNRVQKIV